MLKRLKLTNIKLVNLSRRGSLVLAVGLLLVATTSTYLVNAATCSSSSDCANQINNLRGQNDTAQGKLNDLVTQAGSYQAAIAALQTQIDSIKAVIVSNQVKQAELKQEIIKKQAEIDEQRKILGSALRTMYLDDQMSTIEMLATSRNLSDYVDKEEYRTVAQNKIQETLAQIVALQQQLQQKKADVDTLIANEQKQQTQLDSDRAQQAELLSYNQSQQNNFNSQIKANQALISKLQAQQAAINAVGSHSVYVAASGGSGGACDSGGGNGGYPMPWCNAPKDTVVTSFHPSPGNYTNRECTSFAYWYFTSVEGHMDFNVSYGSDAKDWIYNTNYPVRNNPAVGAIGVKTSGTYGHVVIVKALPGQTFSGITVPAGEVLVYEMNSDFQGHFRASLRDINTFGGFLY